MTHDGCGYTTFHDLFTISHDELAMNAGRFGLWSATPCQYEITPKVPPDRFTRNSKFMNLIRSTIEWNASNCENYWHITVELRDGQRASDDNIVYVSFASQRDADEYQVCFALNGGNYESHHAV